MPQVQSRPTKFQLYDGCLQFNLKKRYFSNYNFSGSLNYPSALLTFKDFGLDLL